MWYLLLFALVDVASAGCDGVANSGLVDDACGVCGGGGSSCGYDFATGNLETSRFECRGPEYQIRNPTYPTLSECASECKKLYPDYPGFIYVTYSSSVLGRCFCEERISERSTCNPYNGVYTYNGVPNRYVRYDFMTCVEDECGVCGGDSSSCAGCDGVANSGLVDDTCGTCGGDGSSCTACLENQYVSNHTCKNCSMGMRKRAGDVASGKDTACITREWITATASALCGIVLGVGGVMVWFAFSADYMYIPL